jgi:hypothetical protein
MCTLQDIAPVRAGKRLLNTFQPLQKGDTRTLRQRQDGKYLAESLPAYQLTHYWRGQ